MNDEAVEAAGQWDYIFPIEKSDLADDNKPWLIEGVVAGPDYVDAAGDEFLPQAIQGMADYINDNPIPIKDWHGLNPKYNVNTIFDDEMGETTRAWVDDEGLLHVEAELDKTMPGSQWLRDKIVNKKRKFGLSAKGMAAPPVMISKGGVMRKQIATVIPNEISLTTRPFYQPSLGTVISKAIDEANEAESVDIGDKSVMANDAPKTGDAPLSPEDNKESLLPAVDAAPEKEGVEPVKEVPAPDVMQNVAVAQPQEEVPVEKSETDPMAAFAASLINTMREIARQEIGNSKVETPAPVAPETTNVVPVQKSEAAQPVDRFTVIEKSLSDLADKMERILEVTPEAQAPGVLVQKSEIDAAREALAEMSPSEKMRAGFQLMGTTLR